MTVQNMVIALRKPIIDNDGWTWEYQSPNINFNPDVMTNYLTYQTLPARSLAGELGTHLQQNIGIFRIQLFVPERTGDSEILAKADEIKSAYQAADPITYNGTSVRIETVSVSQADRLDDQYTLSLDIQYQSYF